MVPGTDDLDAWHVLCRLDFARFDIEQVWVGEEADCIGGNVVEVLRVLKEYTAEGPTTEGTLFTLTTGICELTYTVTVYGFGVRNHGTPVPCATMD